MCKLYTIWKMSATNFALQCAQLLVAKSKKGQLHTNLSHFDVHLAQVYLAKGFAKFCLNHLN